MIRFLISWWNRRLRRIDVAILWPECKRWAPGHDLDHARAAFAVHAFNDHAYSDLTETEIHEFIEGLT